MPSLLLLISLPNCQSPEAHCVWQQGAVIRADTTQKQLALIFTGGDYSEGGTHIRQVLARYGISAGFFFTGDFYRHPENEQLIRLLIRDGHYLGPHSDRHLLYCAWENRDSLLVTETEFKQDLAANYRVMQDFGIPKSVASYFIPPYEWYNRQIVQWAREMDVRLFNYSPGTLSAADYTLPGRKNYRSSAEIFTSIMQYEQQQSSGLNGFILLMHIGTHPSRKDKFYHRLEELLEYLNKKEYQLRRIDHLLSPCYRHYNGKYDE